MQKKPKAVKIPGAPRHVPGRVSGVRQQGNKWIYNFKRGDFADIEFDTEAEALAFMKHHRLLAVKGSPLRVRKV